VVGDGQQTRDFTFVSDIVAALIAASETEKSGRIYNVGSGRTVSINCIVDLLGGDKEYIPKRPGEPDCTFADISRITQEIGWKPQVSIEEGVQELLKDMTYWKDAPVWTPKSIGEATEDWFRYLGPVSQD
jgi:UDP-glucose 4-epimerase